MVLGKFLIESVPQFHPQNNGTTAAASWIVGRINEAFDVGAEERCPRWSPQLLEFDISASVAQLGRENMLA